MIRLVLSSLALLAVAACDRAPDTPAAPASPSTPTTPAPAPPRPAPSPTATPVAGPIPPAFRGRWAGAPSGCSVPHEMMLEILPDRLLFWESEAVVSDILIEDARTVRITANYTGEGESWTGASRLLLSDDGGRVTDTTLGAASTRVRCP